MITEFNCLWLSVISLIQSQLNLLNRLIEENLFYWCLITTVKLFESEVIFFGHILNASTLEVLLWRSLLKDSFVHA